MRRYAVLALLVAVVAGCPWAERPFPLEITPAEIGDAIPNQRCVFLVKAGDADKFLFDGELAALISAMAEAADVYVENPDIRPGEVAEVSIVPRPLEAKEKQFIGPEDGRTICPIITAQYNSLVTKKRYAPINVTSEEVYDLEPEATAMRNLFIPWLAANHPELGITEDTVWSGTIVTPHILVVTHYLFFSDEWEMHVFWHVMIPPYDWTRIELRRRFVETAPSLAFEIPSRSAEPIVVQEIEPSDTLWR